jgi:hypothetical protein
MIIITFDNNNHIVYKYDDNKSSFNFEMALNELNNKDLIDGYKTNGHYFIQKKEETRRHCIFLDNVGNKKDASYIAKIISKGINEFSKIGENNQKVINAIESSISHNTKNIIHTLVNNVKRDLNYQKLYLETDKILYIANLIHCDITKYSRCLLNISKALEQVSFEYNIIDYLKPGLVLQDQDKTRVKIHSLIMQAYYIYEQELKNKNIKLNINQDYTEIIGNFFTLRSAIALILENCVKYCLENYDLEIEIKNISNSYKVDFIMTSIYNSDLEIEQMFLPNFRGDEARSISSGSGLGLFIVKQLLYLNKIDIKFARVNNSIIKKNGIKYSNNIFIIDIPIQIIN